jgi:hypothetical protein
MGILKGYDMTYSMRQQKAEYLGGGELVSDVPGMLIKPSPDRSENIGRENMNMGIDYPMKVFWNCSTFFVFNRWEIRFQHGRSYLE